MKFLKIHIRTNPGSNEMIYPVGYQNEIGVFSVDHLYYEVDGELKLLLCIPDDVYRADMIRTDVEEINEAAVKAISEEKETRVETINDEAKLRRLEVKARLAMSLTTEELDSLDPAKSKSIFGVSEILADRIAKLKDNEVKLALKKVNPIHG